MAKKGGGAGGSVPDDLIRLVRPHVSSYDYMAEEGLQKVQRWLDPVEAEKDGEKLTLSVGDVRIGKPGRDGRSQLPSDAREGNATYKAPMMIQVEWDDGEQVLQKEVNAGEVPVMVGSNRCHLKGKGKKELVQAREEELELGGYFIVNGNERMIRMLLVQRRHFPLAFQRPAYLNRGSDFTDLAVSMRSVREDERVSTCRLHYMRAGGCRLAMLIRRREFFIPLGVILKALSPSSDRELTDRLLACCRQVVSESYVLPRLEKALYESQLLSLSSQADHLEYLGGHFRSALAVPEGVSDFEAGKRLLSLHLLPHEPEWEGKVEILLLLLRKLWALASGSCAPDNPDALSNLEILLPGHLLMIFLSERLREFLNKSRDLISRGSKDSETAFDASHVQRSLDSAAKATNIGGKMEYMLSTGNIQNAADLGLSQNSGFTIIAEKLNYLRWLAHFRSVHRGQYFAQLRTSTVRKMLPESWGFLCPVHTPDGSPCGLLNHLTSPCDVQTHALADPRTARSRIVSELVSKGMVTASSYVPSPGDFIPVMLDGRYEGGMSPDDGPATVDRLRKLKSKGKIPSCCEIVLITPSYGGPFSGLFLFTSLARMARPVRQAKTGQVEYIGTLEQPFLDIRCPDSGAGGSEDLEPSHEELSPTSILSTVASLTPWSDFNQSPRNMYQCQMAKQAMGTPAHSLPHRHDNKMYRLQMPQKPLAVTSTQDTYHVDDYPQGMNAVVAVISYTGYDMEDAMILNKGSMERGLGHGTLYTSESIMLSGGKRSSEEPERFGRPQDSSQKGASSGDAKHLDEDGLGAPGERVEGGEMYACSINTISQKAKPHALKDSDAAYIDQVTVIGGPEKEIQRVNIKKRFPRNPIIGDKFSSRHGQKGTLSLLYPEEDMPFIERNGIRPDILINPNAFPSRMTIGMLVESFASKAGALRGERVDATTFKKCFPGYENRDPVNDFSELLQAEGYQKYGGETMICGVTGKPLKVDIFIGLVYYQRLRHMVADKFQVRSVGPVNQLTHQPVKGRKVGGGIRFGEMERDALIAHGAAYLLHDRMHLCSDRHLADVCRRCGNFLGTIRKPSTASDPARGANPSDKVVCVICDSSEHVVKVAVPYAFRYLVVELASVNVKVRMEVE